MAYQKLDLKAMLKDIEKVMMKHLKLKERPAVGICFTMEHTGWDTAHYATNISRMEGIKLFEDTAERMKAQLY